MALEDSENIKEAQNSWNTCVTNKSSRTGTTQRHCARLLSSKVRSEKDVYLRADLQLY